MAKRDVSGHSPRVHDESVQAVIAFCVICMMVSPLVCAQGSHCTGNRVITDRQEVYPHDRSHSYGQSIAHDGFGKSISVSGSTAVIGAPGLDRAFVYQLVKGIWIQEQVLRPEGPSESFGSGVAISGTTIVVTDRMIYHMNGAAFVFRRDGNRWIQVKVLRPPSGGWQGHFGGLSGIGLALYRNTVYVTGGEAVGNHLRYVRVIYVYQERGGRWTRTVIDARDLPKGDVLGPAIAVLGPRSLADGSVLASVRLKHAPWNLIRHAGQINILRLVHQKWVVSARLSANRPQKGGLLGYPLAASGNEIVATARDGIDVYRKRTGQWYHFWKIKPAPHQYTFYPTPIDQIVKVVLRDMSRINRGQRIVSVPEQAQPKWIWISMPHNTPVAVSTTWVAYGFQKTWIRGKRGYWGIVFLFKQEHMRLVAVATLAPPPFTRQQQVAFVTGTRAVSLSGNWLAVGAKNLKTQGGLVYFYHLNPGASGCPAPQHDFAGTYKHFGQ